MSTFGLVHVGFAGVANSVPERIRHLVFLDAFVPSDGENIYDQGYPRMAATSKHFSVPAPEWNR